jgi:hypothetical protein
LAISSNGIPALEVFSANYGRKIRGWFYALPLRDGLPAITFPASYPRKALINRPNPAGSRSLYHCERLRDKASSLALILANAASCSSGARVSRPLPCNQATYLDKEVTAGVTTPSSRRFAAAQITILIIVGLPRLPHAFSQIF